MLFQNGKLAVCGMEKNDRFILGKWLSDPAVLEFYEGWDNLFTLRYYEKCGFKKVKRLRNHELHEGVYQDCWLMEYKVDVD